MFPCLVLGVIFDVTGSFKFLYYVCTGCYMMFAVACVHLKYMNSRKPRWWFCSNKEEAPLHHGQNAIKE